MGTTCVTIGSRHLTHFRDYVIGMTLPTARYALVPWQAIRLWPVRPEAVPGRPALQSSSSMRNGQTVTDGLAITGSKTGSVDQVAPLWVECPMAGSYLESTSKNGGAAQIRTGDRGFADLCLTTWRRRRSNLGRQATGPADRTEGCGGTHRRENWSGKRDSNPRLRPWQGRTLPLSYSRSDDRTYGTTTASTASRQAHLGGNGRQTTMERHERLRHRTFFTDRSTDNAVFCLPGQVCRPAATAYEGASGDPPPRQKGLACEPDGSNTKPL